MTLAPAPLTPAPAPLTPGCRGIRCSARCGGFATVRSTSNAHGEPIGERYFGTHGEPVTGDAGWSRRALAYDARGRQIEERLFDAGDHPVAGSAGWATRRVSYDSRGLETEVALLGSDGKPTLGSEGWALRRARYDQHKNRIEQTLFDAAGRPARLPDGARVTSVFDRRGRLVEEAHFGAEGEPILTREGFHIRRIAYDRLGRAVETARFGVSGQPQGGLGGWSIERLRLDTLGRPIRRDLFGSDGKPALGSDGWAGTLSRYDRFGQRIEERFLGLDGQPTENRGAIAGRLFRYDDEGREIARTDFAEDGQAIGGIGRDRDGGTYAYRLIAGRLEVCTGDGKPLPVRALAESLTPRIEAQRIRLTVERLRVSRPNLFRNANGVLVVEAGPRSATHGFQPGDVLLELDGRRLERPLDVTALLGQTGLARLSLIRNGEGEVWSLPPSDLADLALEPE